VKGYSNSLITDYMKLKFPGIHEQIVRIKEREQYVYDVLVKIESNFIFKVVGELYKQYDSIKLLTVHDSIYTNASDYDKLEAEWNVQLQNLFDLLPSNEISPEEMNNQTENILDMEIEEIDELDFDYSSVSSTNNRQRYLLEEFEDFSDDVDDDLYMKL
jgi:hypothetical protein